MYLPLNPTLTLTLPTLLLSTVFNMVQEFGTAVYRIAQVPRRIEEYQGILLSLWT